MVGVSASALPHTAARRACRCASVSRLPSTTGVTCQGTEQRCGHTCSTRRLLAKAPLGPAAASGQRYSPHAPAHPAPTCVLPPPALTRPARACLASATPASPGCGAVGGALSSSDGCAGSGAPPVAWPASPCRWLPAPLWLGLGAAYQRVRRARCRSVSCSVQHSSCEAGCHAPDASCAVASRPAAPTTLGCSHPCAANLRDRAGAPGRLHLAGAERRGS